MDSYICFYLALMGCVLLVREERVRMRYYRIVTSYHRGWCIVSSCLFLYHPVSHVIKIPNTVALNLIMSFINGLSRGWPNLMNRDSVSLAPRFPGQGCASSQISHWEPTILNDFFGNGLMNHVHYFYLPLHVLSSL